MRRSTALFLVCGIIAGLYAVAPALGAVVTTTGDDGFGTSSFNSAGVWSNAAAPSSGNDYFVDDEDRIRTPADNGSHSFAGDSLTVQSTGSGGDYLLKGLTYKGTGTGATITVPNLVLDGGSINHLNGAGDEFNLYGSLDVVSDSYLFPKQGPIFVFSDIGGTAQITVPASDGDIRDKLWIGSSANTFTGDIINNGRLGLMDDAVFNFMIGVTGVNNSITSPGGQQHITLDGDFVFDLSGASTTDGDSWLVIGTTPASTYYGSTFTVADFTPQGDVDGTWTKPIDDSSLYYQFQQSTGLLTVAPEPGSLALLALGGLALLRRRS